MRIEMKNNGRCPQCNREIVSYRDGGIVCTFCGLKLGPPTIGYEPTQTSVLPTDAAERKTYPIYSGCINYFPDALALVAKRSYEGNQQHHPDKPLHWDKSKSSDELDAMIRHIIEGEWDAVAWRGLAHLQRMLDKGWRPKECQK